MQFSYIALRIERESVNLVSHDLFVNAAERVNAPNASINADDCVRIVTHEPRAHILLICYVLRRIKA